MVVDLYEFTALLLSIAIESCIVFMIGKTRRLNGQILMLSAISSTLITHPFLWKLFLDLEPHLNFVARSLLLETGVVLIEGFLYRWITQYSWRCAMGLSFCANLTSYLAGLLFYSVR
jgi:hypothetical protein